MEEERKDAEIPFPSLLFSRLATSHSSTSVTLSLRLTKFVPKYILELLSWTVTTPHMKSTKLCRSRRNSPTFVAPSAFGGQHPFSSIHQRTLQLKSSTDGHQHLEDRSDGGGEGVKGRCVEGGQTQKTPAGAIDYLEASEGRDH